MDRRRDEGYFSEVLQIKVHLGRMPSILQRLWNELIGGAKKAPPKRQCRPADTSRKPAQSESQKRTLVFADFTLEYTLVRSRRKTIGMEMKDGAFTVRSPLRTPLKEIEKVLLSKASWIAKALEHSNFQNQDRCRRKEKVLSGGRIPYFGSEIFFRCDPSAKTTRLSGGELIVALAEDATEEAILGKIRDWYKKEARRVLPAMVAEKASEVPLVGRCLTDVRISSAKTRWGSCTSKGSISLNWKLLMYAPETADYVISHELAHLKEMNHSPAFWAVVESYCPKWKEAEAALKRISLSRTFLD